VKPSGLPTSPLLWNLLRQSSCVALTALLNPGVNALHAQAGQKCDATVMSRAIPVERNIVLTAMTADSTARLPRPLIDDVMEKFGAAFQVPANLSLALYHGPTYLPADSGSGNRQYAHPSLHAVVRVKFDRRGVLLRATLFDETFDTRLDSAFVASLGAAFPDSSATALRSEMSRDTLVVDFYLGTEPSITKRQRAEVGRQISLGRLLEMPVARIMLPYFPDAKAARPLPATGPTSALKYLGGEMIGAITEVHAVLDTAGRFGAIWVSEATNQAAANVEVEHMRMSRFVPATIGGCPVPVRTVFRTRWVRGTTRPDSEYRPGSIPPPHD
jgi:hypothetical protein